MGSEPKAPTGQQAGNGRGGNRASEPSQYLENFGSIARPSHNYSHNIATFYYRISELMFGSLLASYILGFIAFAAVLHLPPRPDGLPNQISDALVDALTLHSFGLWVFLQNIVISILYSSFTALLYVNFHQSIVYMALDQRKASYDFFIATLIGITFGISMVFPQSVIFWLGVLTLLAFIRKITLLKEYGRHVCLDVAKEAGWNMPKGTSPYDAKQREEIVATVKPILQKELLASNSRVAKSWGHVGALYMWVAIGVTLAVPILMYILGSIRGVGTSELIFKFPGGPAWEFFANLGLSLIVLVILIVSLIRAGHTMPSREELEDQVLDLELNEILKKVRDYLNANPGRWKLNPHPSGPPETPGGPG